MKKEDIELFTTTLEQMKTFYKEISSLSQKKPHDSLNKFKLQLINRVLSNSNLLLKEQFKPFCEFSSFDESELPSNSDVTVMLSQYLDSMERFRSRNIIYASGGKWLWLADSDKVRIKTYPPVNSYDR